MAYCTCAALLLFFVFSGLYPYCICGHFIFLLGAVRLLWQPSDCMAIFVMFFVSLSENKYDDDDERQNNVNCTLLFVQRKAPAASAHYRWFAT